VLLCTRHHRFVHETGYSIRDCGGKLEFRDPWGAPILNVPRPPPGDPRMLIDPNRDAIDAQTCACGDGDRMDLGLTIDALLSLRRSSEGDLEQAHDGLELDL
jgi:hypothetical protein